MSMDFVALTALVTPVTKLILQTLASRKRAQLTEILDVLKSNQLASSEGDALASLSKLKALNLVEEKGAVLPRWNTYLVTSEGLEATRKLFAR